MALLLGRPGFFLPADSVGFNTDFSPVSTLFFKLFSSLFFVHT